MILHFITPSEIIQKTVDTPFRNPERVNALFYGILLRIAALGVFILAVLWFSASEYYPKAKAAVVKLLTGASKALSLNFLLYVTLIYVIVLFVMGVVNYDLGTDESWYICLGENFSKTLIPYYTSNGEIFIIDTISMLPYYAVCFVNYGLGLTEVWHFKLVAVIFSVAALITLFRVFSKRYDKQVAVIFLFFLALQPGFGYVATSFFGELLQSAFIITGLYIWLKSPGEIDLRRIIIVALFFTAAIHTKFQLILLLTIILLILHFTDRKTLPLKILLYTFMFTALLSLLRTIPVLISEPSSFRSLVVINLFAEKLSNSSFYVILERFQFLNRFFPLGVLTLIALGFSFYCMKDTFDRFIMSFSVVTSLWWIFFWPIIPYRVAFMGFILLALMAAIIVRKVYTVYTQKYPNRSVILKYALTFSALFLMMYGYSANLIYAYIGYNDGVQFDLDGFKSRFISGIERDNSQKEFFAELKKVISPEDTIYNCYSVTTFYVKNPFFRLDKMKTSLENSGSEKYVLITRDMYPLGFDEIYSRLDSMGLNKRMIIKKPGHELYGVTKNTLPQK